MESWRGRDDLVCGRVGGRAPSGLRAWAAASGCIVQHALAEPFKRDRAHLPKNLPVCFLDFSHHCTTCGHVIVPPAKVEIAEPIYSSTGETRRQFDPNIEIAESQNRTLAPAPVNRRR